MLDIQRLEVLAAEGDETACKELAEYYKRTDFDKYLHLLSYANPFNTITSQTIVAIILRYVKSKDENNIGNAYRFWKTFQEVESVPVEERKFFKPILEEIKKRACEWEDVIPGIGWKTKLGFHLGEPYWFRGVSSDEPETPSHVEFNKHIKHFLLKKCPKAKFTVRKGGAYGYSDITFKKTPPSKSEIHSALIHMISEKFDGMTDSYERVNNEPYQIDGLWYRPVGKGLDFEDASGNKFYHL